MKIICNKEILLNAINTVLKAVPSKTTTPILECILLKTNDSEFKMMATDLELGIETNLKNIEILENGSVALEARILSEIVRRLPDDDIEISTDEKNKTTIKCLNSEYQILGQSGDEFPDLPVIEKKSEYTLQQSKLKDLIRQTIFSVSTEETKMTLTGELIEVIDNYINIIAVDGYRVSFRKHLLSNENENIKAIVPAKSLNELNKILSADEQYEVSLYFTDKHILFDLGDSILISRLIEGDFINYNQIFTDDYNTVVTVNRKNIILCLERASLITRENKKTPLKLEIKGDKIVITSNTELGNAHEEVESTINGNELIIAFNPKYLIDALKAIDDDIINIYFNSTLSPCIIKPIESDSYKYLVLPVRLNS